MDRSASPRRSVAPDSSSSIEVSDTPSGRSSTSSSDERFPVAAGRFDEGMADLRGARAARAGDTPQPGLWSHTSTIERTMATHTTPAADAAGSETRYLCPEPVRLIIHGIGSVLTATGIGLTIYGGIGITGHDAIAANTNATSHPPNPTNATLIEPRTHWMAFAGPGIAALLIGVGLVLGGRASIPGAASGNGADNRTA